MHSLLFALSFEETCTVMSKLTSPTRTLFGAVELFMAVLFYRFLKRRTSSEAECAICEQQKGGVIGSALINSLLQFKGTL